jgi:soluble lytic murein transglycosylase-like protein
MESAHAAKREARLERLAKIKARRLEASEKRKAAAKARLKVAKNKTKTKSIKTTLASTDKIKTAERPGWVRKDGKFIYRSARTIKAEQEAEAARKKELARQKAIARKKAARNKTRSGGKSLPKGNYNKLIAKYAAQNGIPYRLARAVVFVESSFRANATGGVGEIGLMQIRLATARGMGYKGSAKQLYNPATNLFWGMKYLGKAHRLAGGSTCGTILKYNAGHGAKRMNPISQRYCNRIRRII